MSEQSYREMERAHDFHREIIRRASDATVESGQLAARMIIVINGAAVVAMLAFVGNFATRGQLLAGVADSMIYFASGVVSGTVTLGATYFANFAGTATLHSMDQIREWPYLRENAGVRVRRGITFFFMAVAMLSGVIGLILFAWGTWKIKDAIRALI
jgi:hypothetical protein